MYIHINKYTYRESLYWEKQGRESIYVCIHIYMYMHIHIHIHVERERVYVGRSKGQNLCVHTHTCIYIIYI